MKVFPKLSAGALFLIAFTIPAFAGVTVASPYNNSTVGSPFTLSASASSCSNQSIVSMGYSLDNSTSTKSFSGSAINTSVSAAIGGHTLHVKAWGAQGAACLSDVAITVSDASISNTGPSVSAPLNSAIVTSPFTVSASHGTCNGEAVTSMGYSLDNSTSTYTVSGTVLHTTATSGTGGHTLHVKSWGKSTSCISDIAVTVAGTSSIVPSTASSISNIENVSNWQATHDPGTPGSSTGSMSIVSSPSRSGSARKFYTTYSNYGGERYSAHVSDNTSHHNFVYDAWLYIQNSNAGIANIEMDLNQVIGNGYTVIMGFQCTYWTGKWEYTVNKGSATSPIDKWVSSPASCNPKSWSVNTWHHVQIGFSRTDGGHVTYQYVALDGVKQTLNITAFSGFALHWAPTVVTNFQVGGATSGWGSSTIILDDVNISSW